MSKICLNARDKQILSDEWCRRYYADAESGYIDISFRDGVEWADEHPLVERKDDSFLVDLDKEQCDCILVALKNLSDSKVYENKEIETLYEKFLSLVSET